MWLLRAPGPDGHEWTFRILAGGTKTVGRAVRADFQVDAAMVSRVHCRLAADTHDRLEVEDLGSTNGTFVNERRITRAVLAPGDHLRIGRVEFFVSRETPAPDGSA